MSTPWVFDQAHYEALNAARGETLRDVLPGLKAQFGLKTVLDLGCGLGHFTDLLAGFDLEVLGVDGRSENVAEAAKRYPHLKFEVGDAQDPNLSRLGNFDLVFCFGLLYHLENPFCVIRTISSLTPKLTLVEGMVYPSPEPAMVLMDENDCVDQGLNLMAFYPSETCLVKMLRRSGFPDVYVPEPPPNHPAYHPADNGFRQRTLMAAAKVPLKSSCLMPWPEPSPVFAPWSMKPLYTARRATKLYGAVDRLLRAKEQ